MRHTRRIRMSNNVQDNRNSKDLVFTSLFLSDMRHPLITCWPVTLFSTRGRSRFSTQMAPVVQEYLWLLDVLLNSCFPRTKEVSLLCLSNKDFERNIATTASENPDQELTTNSIQTAIKIPYPNLPLVLKAKNTRHHC